MNKLSYGLIVFAASLGVASPAVALPGMPKIPGLSKQGGEESKEKASSVSVDQVEKDLKLSIIKSSRAIAAFQTALGQKEQADIASKNAACLEKNECGLKDAVAVVQTSSSALKAKIDEQKSAGVKLSAGSGKIALDGMVNSFAALSTGIKAVKAGKSLMSNTSMMMKAGGLIRLMPSALQALTGIGGTFGTGLTYLSFSGVNTKTAQGQLAESLGGSL
jgi:hypothetical protein